MGIPGQSEWVAVEVDLILAVDPGDKQSAWVIWDEIAERPSNMGIWDNEDIIGFTRVPEIVAIEMVSSYGMPVGKTVFETVFWIGRFWQKFFELGKGIKPLLIYRKDIKMHLCNSMRAKDSNIRQALIDRYGKPGTKKDKGVLYGVKKDIWSAVAVAVYMQDKHIEE